MTLAPVVMPITPGTMFYNKYTLASRIGCGSFGEVWLGRDQAVNHEFAIKILNAGVGIDQRLREAQIGHAFTHENLVRVHQADVAVDGKVVIAMDYFANGAVTTLANPGNFIPLPIALKITIGMLQGLEHLHLHNFFHNDIKPQNILRGPQGQAKLADYGIVGISTDGKPVQPSFWYVLHAAPETIAGNGIEARTDVLQSGLTLYRMLVGLGDLEARFNSMGNDAYAAAMAAGTLIKKGDFPAFIPNSLSRIVLRAVHPQPQQRFQSALEMRRALENVGYAGYWSVDGNGVLFGEDARSTYRFEHVVAVGSNSRVSAFKTNKSSGRETRVSEYTRSSMTSVEAHRLVVSFMRAVVEGRV